MKTNNGLNKVLTMFIPKRRNRCSAPYTDEGETLSAIAFSYC